MEVDVTNTFLTQIYRRLCHYYVRAALPDMRPPTASSILATDLKTNGEITAAPAL